MVKTTSSPTHTLWSIVIHVAAWACVFASTLMIIFQGREVNMPFLVKSLNLNIVTFLLFYANYLWLIPRFIERGRLNTFIIINALLLIAAAVQMYEVNLYAFTLEAPTHRRWQPRGRLPQWIFILRDLIALLATIGASVAIRFSMQRQKAINAQKEAELGRSRAELLNLRNQINPHFLLNTLNNIYALIAFNTDKAQKAVLDLSEMLRYILYDNEREHTTLRKEAEFLKNYIELMRLRQQKNVEVSVNLDINHHAERPIAPLIFISLVENAFKHGVSPTNQSFIRISMHVNEGMLTFVTENSHYPKTAHDHSGSGIGLQQVEQRLAYSYPGKHTWHHGLLADGTVYRSEITIQLP